MRQPTAANASDTNLRNDALCHNFVANAVPRNRAGDSTAGRHASLWEPRAQRSLSHEAALWPEDVLAFRTRRWSSSRPQLLGGRPRGRAADRRPAGPRARGTGLGHELKATSDTAGRAGAARADRRHAPSRLALGLRLLRRADHRGRHLRVDRRPGRALGGDRQRDLDAEPTRVSQVQADGLRV
jgi:hypothetical protein